MKYKTYTWNDVREAAYRIQLQMYKDNWRPDYIVGITRGGLPLSVMLSHMLDCRMYTLDVSLRDGGDAGLESNLWMAEDAFGYIPLELQETYKSRWDIDKRKKILIVDDINDTGATFNWIKQDWQSSCLPDSGGWDTVWNSDRANVRFAVITENLSSEFDLVKYNYDEVNKAEEDVWLIYPWEE